MQQVLELVPADPYILFTCSKVCTKRLAVHEGSSRCSMVTKLVITRDDVTKEGNPFTNITSATNVKYLCSWINPLEFLHI